MLKRTLITIAAAEEIQEHWQAHCDKDGYGLSSLMHRIEQGIPSQYGYTAGRFAEMKAELEAKDVIIEEVKGYAEKINEYTWLTYKKQALLAINQIVGNVVSFPPAQKELEEKDKVIAELKSQIHNLQQ